MPGNAAALTDERALLLAYIAKQREGLRNAAFGLTDEQARSVTRIGGELSPAQGCIVHLNTDDLGDPVHVDVVGKEGGVVAERH